MPNARLLSFANQTNSLRVIKNLNMDSHFAPVPRQRSVTWATILRAAAKSTLKAYIRAIFRRHDYPTVYLHYLMLTGQLNI